MNDKIRDLIHSVCDGDILKSQQQARNILEGLSSKKDEKFQENMLRKLDSKKPQMLELPYNLKELLIAEDMTAFPESRFILREKEKKAVEETLSVLGAANSLSELGIKYTPTLMLYGVSGGGKTMLAKYIAHRADLPFIYVRFSSMVSSYLGSTQSNISKVFEYARTVPCVLCFDEIDAIGMARGQKNDVGEMNRIVIALMQEMDSLPNNVIVIGTTNRHDRLDEALLRRFNLQHEILPLSKHDALELAKKFFEYAGYSIDELGPWCENCLDDDETADAVVSKCTSKIVDDIVHKGRNND